MPGLGQQGAHVGGHEAGQVLHPSLHHLQCLQLQAPPRHILHHTPINCCGAGQVTTVAACLGGTRAQCIPGVRNTSLNSKGHRLCGGCLLLMTVIIARNAGCIVPIDYQHVCCLTKWFMQYPVCAQPVQCCRQLCPLQGLCCSPTSEWLSQAMVLPCCTLMDPSMPRSSEY